eukprot:COSAG02_NODE_522_length_20749_cov_14.985278_12_plen_39_part_00
MAKDAVVSALTKFDVPQAYFARDAQRETLLKESHAANS